MIHDQVGNRGHAVDSGAAQPLARGGQVVEPWLVQGRVEDVHLCAVPDDVRTLDGLKKA